MSNHDETEIWEASCQKNQAMWGFEPAPSARLTMKFFVQNNVKNVLIPGIGYGRNAQIFRDHGIAVTGIEISISAIKMAHQHFGKEMTIYHGSVVDMPYDQIQYDGIFCYALIHLLDAEQRKKLVMDCYNQLSLHGYMVFVVVSKEAHIYGTGRYISQDRYEVFAGIEMFFYDTDSIQQEFGKAGLMEISRITESFPFYMIKCKKETKGLPT